jgi:uncharacterized damage-inducible protein DinB
MTTKPDLSPEDLLFPELEGEHAATRRVLERYPEGTEDWRPHVKSTPLGRLAAHVAELVNLGTTILETDGTDVSERRPVPPLPTAAELVSFFDANVARFHTAISSVDLSDLDRPWTFRFKDRVLLKRPKRTVMRTGMINHIIHHRAQLTVYYRLLDVPVPGLYGPTADEPM